MSRFHTRPRKKNKNMEDFKVDYELLAEHRIAQAELQGAQVNFLLAQKTLNDAQANAANRDELLVAHITEAGKYELVGGVDPKTRIVKRKLISVPVVEEKAEAVEETEAVEATA